MNEFRQVWAVDFEYGAPSGERPDPVCMVARELRSGTNVRLWQDELRSRRLPPYSLGRDSLFVAYYASAELGCHLALGWPLPERVLDLCAEFRAVTNGKRITCGKDLLGALAQHGLPAMDAAEKDSMRQLVLSGGPWSEQQQRDILDYCESDVDALAKLLPRMLPRLDLPRALLRGQYMAAAAHMEHTGVPIDTCTLGQLRTHWDSLKSSLIAEIDRDYGVFDGTTFKVERFARWLVTNNVPWPRLPTGKLDLGDETFREMAKVHPSVSPLRELRSSLSKFRLNELAVGHDGRNRVMLSAFKAKSGRNAPSNSKFIFGPSVWLRGLIQPPPGRAIGYCDWSQQEFGIAAVLSGDGNMQAAYLSDDPYLTFAKQAKAAPPGATKASHGQVRELFKQCVLGTQYGMGADSLGQRIGQPTIVARDLLRAHRQTYRKFWQWSDSVADQFAIRGKLWTVFGWPLHSDAGDGERTARNYPMQGNGAEMMRLAACRMVDAGLDVCAPVHDAFLIEAPADEIDAAVQLARQCMAQASADVLAGFTLRTDATVYRAPDRYMDARGARMWQTVMALLPPMRADATSMRVDAAPMCADAAGVPLINKSYI